MSLLTDLSALVARTTVRGGPAYYRELYKLTDEPGLLISTWDEWYAIPYLTKSVLQDIAIEDRTFVEWGDISSIHSSSGTSGKPPHFSPWIRLDGYEYRDRFHTFKKSALCSMPIHHQHEQFLIERGVHTGIVVFDPRNVRASVELARLSGVDSLFIFTGHLALIGPEMERRHMCEDIRFIELAGESCSRSLYQYAARVFPNATIVSFYGATEVENPPITYPCHALSESDPLEVHHSREGYYIELIDPDSGAVLPIQNDIEGEIVLTFDTRATTKPSVSPLVRYRTGDMAKVVDEKCTEHQTWSFVMTGRKDMDFVKITGGIIRADEIERVLRAQGSGVYDIFEARVAERDDGGSVQSALTVMVHALPGADFSTLADRIARGLRVAPAFTYQDGIDRGIYAPIVCLPLQTPYSIGKRKRLIREDRA